ncbi:MAG: 1-acyl-sn-glycerol-3-phosphate acyltransferase [Chloroflexi bacterium]|nr:1-acyl-sn-glycerol-3-phosphate acyltransferase [Chloroflexota bacterium]
MTPSETSFKYPRRRLIRWLMSRAARLTLGTLADFRIEGQENLPKEGPLIVVANHFHFIDVVTIVASMPWPLDFLGGFNFIDAPRFVTWLPQLWGYYPVRRGSASMLAIRAAKAVLAQEGALMVFPEGGSWAEVLVYARPGVPYLTAQTGAPILPVGIDGNPDIFSALRRRRRARVTVRIGKPFGPYRMSDRGRARRQRLDEIGHDIMRHIAELIPPSRHGVYSQDPTLRAAAEEVAAFPWEYASEVDAGAKYPQPPASSKG